MRFNLPCFVLVQVRTIDDDDAPQVTIHDFYPSPDAALAAVPALKEKLAKQWALNIGEFFGVPAWKETDYHVGRFFVLTLTDTEFKFFTDLESTIESSALAHWRKEKPLVAAQV